ncbi:MAG: FmdE family protein [Bacillota bacterium]
MLVTEKELKKAVEFHGHVCVGLMIGLRAGAIALEGLGVERAGDEELVTIVENESCAVDGVQSLTGCTVGKGNLLLRDYGKQVFTIGSRKTGKAIRVAMKYEARGKMSDYRKLTPEEFMAIPSDTLFDTRQIPLDFPQKARIFSSVCCAHCGEAVMEPRARVKDGEVVCMPCAGEYPNRWS